MAKPNFFERLSTTTPLLRPEDGLKGHERMAVVRGNNQLRKHFEHVRDHLAHLLINVRWGRLHMPKKDFAEAAGISTNGYKPMELDRAKGADKQHRIKYTRVIEFWKQNGISAGIREQCLQLLDGATTVAGFYNRAGFEMGYEQVESIVGTPIYNTLWQRNKMGTVPKCRDFLHHVELLYPEKINDEEAQQRRIMRIEEAKKVWSLDKKTQYKERGIEDILVQLLVNIELYLAFNFKQYCTVENIAKTLGVTEGTAHSIITTGFPKYEKIESIAKKVFPAKDQDSFRVNWDEQLRNEQMRPSFRLAFERAMREKGINYGHLSRAVNILAPEVRDPSYEAPDRSQRYRGDSIVRKIVRTPAQSWMVPADAIIACVANSALEELNLKQIYTAERERHFQRVGAALSGKGLAMRILRERVGVEMKELAGLMLPDDASAEEVRQKDLRLQRLERGEGDAGDESMDEVISVLVERGKQRVVEATARLEGRELGIRDHNFGPFALTRTEIRSILINVLDPVHVTDALVREIMLLPEDSIDSLAYLGDRSHPPKSHGRIEVLKRRFELEISMDHPYDRLNSSFQM